ncbi:hypothetical protein H6F43_03860 [Leptolyngbya sp. FACHB-36]|uniref:hypothetical protein n=1 Tax=Leptolyngbya sp. FACHB-36 TaxID=2692808 RepID=UPI001681101B|nr:hypothetical protein [Leptolyngbya sp. FACHB-36]MBD2019318.1 hypothetical protein [Leptolyngbya sp. FACHB-36]
MEMQTEMEEAYIEDQLLSDDPTQESLSLTDQKAQGLLSILLNVQEDTVISSRTWNLKPNPYVFYGPNQTPFGQVEGLKATIMTYQKNGTLLGKAVFTSAVASLGWTVRAKPMTFSLLDKNNQVLSSSERSLSIACSDDGLSFSDASFAFPANLFDQIQHVNVRYERATWYKCP